jgi:hypothetical protein
MRWPAALALLVHSVSPSHVTLHLRNIIDAGKADAAHLIAKVDHMTQMISQAKPELNTGSEKPGPVLLGPGASKLGKTRVAALIIGDLRSGVAKPLADGLKENVIDPNLADVFMCVSDSVYDQIGDAINQSTYGYIPRDGWQAQFPTLKALKFRQRLADPSFNFEDAPCMAGDSRPSTRFRRFWPMFKGWECALDLMKAHEQKEGFKYDFVIRMRPDIGLAGPVVIPDYLKNSEQSMVTGLAYYHKNLMCDHMHFASRGAIDALATVYKGVQFCNSLEYGGQQCCGGEPQQVPWKPPDWCNMPHTMVNETECMVDRWLRNNSVVVDNSLEVPGGKILVYRWISGKEWAPINLQMKPEVAIRCPWK